MSFVRLLAINLGLVLALLVVIEGIGSFGLLLRDAWKTTQVAERRHTEYDSLLGWSNVPGTFIEDMYGNGVSLTINGQGFRGKSDVDQSLKTDFLRIICSGDSFTLGYGVSDEETWCHLLSKLNPRIEPVNLGQGGYGVDQAYLWFMRDGTKFKHHVQIFTLIDDDFERMKRNTFSGYPKPLLAIRENELVPENVPVPSQAGILSRLTANRAGFERMAIVRFAQGIARRVDLQQPVESGKSDKEVSLLTQKIVENLVAYHANAGSQLLLVYLPTTDQLLTRNETRWSSLVATLAENNTVHFLDAGEKFRLMPFDAASELYIKDGEVPYPGAAGHLNSEGNAVFANLVNEKLQSMLSSNSDLPVQ